MMYTPDKIDSGVAFLLVVVVLANNGSAVAIIGCLLAFWLQYGVRRYWKAFFATVDWLRGIQPAQSGARVVAHRSEPLDGGALSISVPVPESGVFIDDNPFMTVAPQPGANGTLRLHAIANDDNILVVGPKGSGKTTLLRALIRLRKGEHLSLDPHNAPGKWPCAVVGGGRNFVDIDRILQGTYHGLNKHYVKLNTGEVREGQFRRHTLVGDEWRAISQELPGDRNGKMSAGTILSKVLTEGRKVAICFLAASHNDTAASVGLAGDMAILTCFDWIIYLGALASRKMPEAARFPRPAVAYHPERDACYLLDVSDAKDLAGSMPLSSVSQVQAPNPPEPSSIGFGLPDAGSASGSVQFGSPNPLPANRTELVQLAKALTIFQQTGKETEAIEQAFGVHKGSSKEYQRARALFKMVMQEN